MKITNLFILVLTLVSCQTRHQNANDSEWIQLFNGTDLTGWDLKLSGYELNDNFNNTFRVEDGLLKIRYDEYEMFNGEFGHLFFNQKFSHYKLRVEYRFVGEQIDGGPEWAYKNNGVMFHAQAAESMGLDQDFPVSIEAQLLGGSGEGERTTGNVCTPGTNIVMDGKLITQHCTSSHSKTYHGEEWVIFELVVKGDEIIHHIVNGDTVMTYSRPQTGGGNKPEDYPVPDGTPLTEGYIAVQAESHPTDFRKIELLDLGKK